MKNYFSSEMLVFLTNRLIIVQASIMFFLFKNKFNGKIKKFGGALPFLY